jgi:hypothetical protein
MKGDCHLAAEIRLRHLRRRLKGLVEWVSEKKEKRNRS